MSLSADSGDSFKASLPDFTAPDSAAAVRFLTEIAAKGPMTVVTIGVAGAVRYKTFATGDAASLKDMKSFIGFHESVECQVFYLPNQARDGFAGVPGNDDIAVIRSIVLDFDPDKSKPLEEERERLKGLALMFMRSPVQPREIVDTGGGMQVLWQLIEPLPATPDSILAIESLMKSLARSFGCDTATCKVKNLFRVPGTINHPTPAKRAAGRVKCFGGLWHYGGPRTALSDLQALATVRPEDGALHDVQINVTEHEVLECLGQPDNLPGDIIEMLREPRFTPFIEKMAAPPNEDRSFVDFAFCCQLVMAGLATKGVALALAAYGSEKVHERGFAYIVTTVRNAFKQAGIDKWFIETNEAEARQESEQQRRKQHDRLKPLTVAEALSGLFDADSEALIEGFLDPSTMAVLYGRPGSGKTFVASDLGYRISLGKTWNNRKVRQTGVVYIATESPRSVRYRLKALRDMHGDSEHFYLVAATVNMYDPRVDLKPLVDEITALGVTIGLIVIDTLARSMIGGNENSTQDMSRLIANGDKLRDRFGSCVLWVHHSGKNEALGARGSSALLAATDTEIEISDNMLRTTKMRDHEDVNYRFRLKPVPVGVMPDGEKVTTCVVDWFESSAAPVGRNTPGNVALSMVVDILRESGKEEFMTFKDIIAAADNSGRKFPVKQNSLRQALDRSCKNPVEKIFLRRLTGKRSAQSRKDEFEYGLHEW